MIKINKIHSQEFVQRYISIARDEILIPNFNNLITEIPVLKRREVQDLFTTNFLYTLLIAEPSEFETIINRVFSVFPALAERYCYSYLLRNMSIDIQYRDLELTSPSDRDTFDDIVDNVISQLQALQLNQRLLYLTPQYISILTSNVARNKKRKVLVRLDNAKRGKSQITDKLKVCFPDWINKFEACFDYGRLAEQLGADICQNLELEICPYCGVENIQTYIGEGIDIRPDLDHFYPKTRFPFLAISIYNLIPAGTICNQKHKKNYPMLEHMHPYIDSLNDDVVFDFMYRPGFDIKDDLFINILQQNELKEKNINIFKLREFYNKNMELRRWFSTSVELIDYLKGSGADTANLPLPLLKPLVDLTEPNTKVSAQKFKVEAINKICETDLVITPQNQ